MKDLIQLYQELSDLTLPVCKTECRVPLSCCSYEYCELTLEWAGEKGVRLERTDHPTLPLMGSEGCTVAPYLRPWCTRHVCCINSLGYKPGGIAWTKKYFALCDSINKLELLMDGETQS